MYIVFFFNDTATTEIYTLSLHDALPILGEDAYGSTVTAPLVKSVIESLVVMAGVPPSNGATPSPAAPAQ